MFVVVYSFLKFYSFIANFHTYLLLTHIFVYFFTDDSNFLSNQYSNT